jgi:c-di-GMP-binding flagellar brake protein YcgR
LELSLEDGPYKGKTTVCGWKEGKYLMLDVPSGWVVKQGRNILARLFSNGSYCGFSSEVIGHFPEINVAVLTFPDDFSESSSRRNGRYPAAIPMNATSEPIPDDGHRNGIITDISMGGLKFTSNFMFSVGQKVFLNFTLPTGQSVTGAAVAIKGMKVSDKKYEYGGEFDLISESVQKAVGKLMDRLSLVELDGTENQQPQASNQLPVLVDGSLQIQLGMQKFIAVFRGGTKKHIIIDAPIIEGKPVIVGRGMACFVRFAHAGMAYGFDTDVFRQYTTPIYIWAINHPGSVRGLSLRKKSRITTFLPAVMETGGASKQVGVIVDLSETGGLFASPSSNVQTEGLCSISFTLPTGQKIQSISCELKNARKAGNKIMIGLLFCDVDNDKLKTIKAYYDTCTQHLS